jgi:hypothetical protein
VNRQQVDGDRARIRARLFAQSRAPPVIEDALRIEEVIFGARHRHDPVRIDIFHGVAQHPKVAMADRAVRMIVLVVKVEQRVSKGPERPGHRAHGTYPGVGGLEKREPLSWKLSRTQQDQFHDEPAGAQARHQLMQPRLTLRMQRAARVIHRRVPVRPDPHDRHTPPGECVEVLVARWVRAERIEQADAGKPSLDAGDRERRPRDRQRAGVGLFDRAAPDPGARGRAGP